MTDGGNGRVLKFVSNHENIPHGWKTAQAYADPDGTLRLKDFHGERQGDWRKNGITLSIATPSEYLGRWELFNQVFNQNVQVEGYARRPDGSLGLVVSQPAIIGRKTTSDEMANYLADLGFQLAKNPQGVKNPLWTWIRLSDGVVLADVKPDNFRTDAQGNVHALDVVTGLASDLRTEPGLDQTTAQQAEQNANTQTAVNRLRYRGIRMERVAGVIGNPNATGASISPNLYVLAMDDVAFNSMRGLVTVIHEGQHSLFQGLGASTQASLTGAAARAMDKLRARAKAASARTGAPVASNFNQNPEEALVETTAQELAADGVAAPEARSMAEALWRWVKDLYLRSARALLEGVGAPQERIDALALAWWDNSIRRTMGGDFEWAFINILDRFLPANSVERTSAQVNSDGSTPGNLPEFIDPITGMMTAPADARFHEESAPQGVDMGDTDLPYQDAWDRIQGAAYNEIIPVFAEMKKSLAPDMADEKWWQIIGIGENPDVTLKQIETRTPGSKSARINGEGMTKAMNERASARALEMMLGARKKIIAKSASATERVNDAAESLAEQSERVSKTDAEYRSAEVLQSSLSEQLKKDVRSLLRAMDQGMQLGRDAGRLGAMLKAGEGLLEGAAIPDTYQAVFKAVLDGSVPIFEYLSALSKLGLNLSALTQSETLAAIRAAAPTDTRLASLVANRPLLNTLVALARTQAKSMALLQLRQMTNAAESLAVKKEMEEIRTASDATLDKMWDDIQKLTDRSSLSARLRLAMLEERRSLRRINRDIREGSETLRLMEGAQDFIEGGITNLEKAVGNHSDWRPVPTFVGKVRTDPQWTAMRPQPADGTWKAETRTLQFTDKDAVADIERVREDLFHNNEWLRQNAELAGTQTYERVKQQTRQIELLDLERQSLAARRVGLIDGLLPSVFKKFKDTGTAGGEQLARGGNRFVNIMREHGPELDGLSQEWTKAFKDFYKQAGAGFRDWNDFYDRVIVPVIYKVESEVGRDEKGALREARATARKLVPSPLDGFDAALEKFLRKEKTASEYLLKVAETNGVFIADPRLGGQLRRAISYGWLTAPRSMNNAVVTTLMKDMAQAGWSVDWQVDTAQNAQGDTVEGRRVLGATTFDKVDTEAPLAGQIGRFFTPDIVERFLIPFIRKAGKPVFYTPDGQAIDSLTLEAAWNEAGGDVATWIDLLGIRSGALDYLNAQKREEGDTATAAAKWRRSILDRIDSRWAMEMRLVHNSGQASNLMQSDRPVMHALMDARLNDDIPPEHLTYAKFDAVSAHARLGQIAYHAAFGRDGSGMDGAVQAAASEIQTRMAFRKEIWDAYPDNKKARERAAKDAGYDYNTLNRANDDNKRITAWAAELSGLFSPGGKSGVLTDLSAGMETMRVLQVMMLNQPTSGLMNAASLLEFPLNYKSFGPMATRASMTALGQFVQRTFGSFAQDIANRNLLDTEYLDWIGPVTDRRGANREWSTKMADVGAGGSYAAPGAGLGQRFGIGTRRLARAAMGAIEKGITPGELVRKGAAAQGTESRFTVLTSPFKFFNDVISQSVALTNVRMFETVMKRAMDYAAQNPGVLDNPNFAFEPDDLKMGGRGFFGDAKALEWMRQSALDYGLGTLENMTRAAIDNKARGDRIFSREQAIKLAIMAMDQVSGEGSIATRPSESYTNPVVRMATPMLGWAMWRSQKVAEAFKNADGTANDLKTFVNGLKVMAFASLPLAYLFSLGMEEWDEWARGKKSTYGARDTFLGVTQRLARVGTLGVVGDLGFGVFTPLDPESGQRKFTLDSKIFAYNTAANVIGGVRDVMIQGLDNTTWASGARNLTMSLGGNGPIQYVQMLNKMGFDVSEAEARVIARQNVYAAVRAAAVTAGVAVKQARGGYGTPTAQGTWLREMQMAAFAGDRLAFRDAYLKAVTVARSDGEQDPEGAIRRGWKYRNPYRPLANDRPTDMELQKMKEVMDPEAWTILQQANRNYEMFTAYIEPTRAEKAVARARKAADPEARLAARRRALAY